jgi:hypothetical protein
MLNNQLIRIFSFGILFRIFFSILLIYFPFTHNVFGKIAPFQYYNTIADIYIYQFYANLSLNDILTTISNIFFDSITIFTITERYPGIIFSLFLKVIPYTEDNYIFLYLVIYFFEIISLFYWILIFNEYFNKKFLILLSITPFSFIYFIFPSIDFLNYFFATLCIYYLNLLVLKKKFNQIKLLVILFIYIFIKPDSVFFCLIILYFYIFNRNYLKLNSKLFIYYVILFVIGILYYFQYYLFEYLTVMSLNNNSFQLSNFYSEPFNSFIKFIMFYLSKFLKIYGLMSKSYSGSDLIILLRLLISIYFIFGFFCAVYFYQKNIVFSFIIIMNLFIILIFLFPSVRYVLIYSNLYLFFIFYFLKKIKLKI